MKKIDVPQEENSILEGHKKVMYTIEGDKFCTKAYGSQAEEFATQVAVNEFNELANDALERFLNAKASPIEYFMYKNRMDLATTASATSFFQFQIKRHFKPKVFKKLSDKKLSQYAQIFMISVKELKDFDGRV